VEGAHTFARQVPPVMAVDLSTNISPLAMGGNGNLSKESDSVSALIHFVQNAMYQLSF
jgi:hypothetical protein